MRVHVLGNACIDTTFRLRRFPLPGETLNASSVTDGLGGKGANQAIAASRIGVPVKLWTALGRDAAGAWIRDVLAGESLDLEVAEFDLPSDRSTIMVDAVGENLIVSGVACAQAFDPVGQTATVQNFEPGDIVVLQGNLRTEATASCLRLAREKGAKTVLNLSPINDIFGLDLRLADILIVNRSEARTLGAQSDVEIAAARLVNRGAPLVIVTLGSEGCLWLSAGGQTIRRLPASKVVAVDTSGAGDVFCGSFVGALANGLDVISSLKVALAAASVAVTRPGTLASCPSAAEMAAILDGMKANHDG